MVETLEGIFDGSREDLRSREGHAGSRLVRRSASKESDPWSSRQ